MFLLIARRVILRGLLGLGYGFHGERGRHFFHELVI